MQQSAMEYIKAVSRWWWIMVISFVRGGVSLYNEVNAEAITFPIWGWIIIMLSGVFIAQFLAFHKLKVERDGLRNQLQERPQLTMGDKTEIKTMVNKQKSEVVCSLELYYQNIGSKPAYQFRMRVGYARDGAPNEFTLFSENTSANPIDPSSIQYGVKHTFTQKYEEKDGKKILKVAKGVLIYCALSYNDAPSGGKSYNEEWWYSYDFTQGRMSSLSIDRKAELEPYVRLALGNRRIA